MNESMMSQGNEKREDRDFVRKLVDKLVQGLEGHTNEEIRDRIDDLLQAEVKAHGQSLVADELFRRFERLEHAIHADALMRDIKPQG